jgi:sulfatase maturation enzyme AslB (radical SAM superfamily)
MKRFLCDLAWNHLSIHPHGTASICCAAKHHNGVSMAKNKGVNLGVRDGVEKIINSDSYKNIRLTMLNGGIPEACEGCHKVEEVGGKSKRLKDSTFKMDFDALTAKDGSIKPNLTNVELRLGNFCNLKCRSCNAESSTSWITDYYKLKDKVPLPSEYDTVKNSPDTDYTWVEKEEFYDDVIANSSMLDVLHISGGEPFLATKHFYLLEKLIKQRNTNIKVFYITNANWDFERIKPALKLLTNFRQVFISFSIDDVGERNTYIRSQSNWELTINNIKKMVTQYPNFAYSVTQTINAYNFLYVEELTQYLIKEGLYVIGQFKPIYTIQLNHVHSPDYQNATVLPKEVRQKKLDSIKGLMPDSNWQELYGRYYNGDDNGQINIFKKVTDAVDEVRGEKFKETFKELNEAIKNKII